MFSPGLYRPLCSGTAGGTLYCEGHDDMTEKTDLTVAVALAQLAEQVSGLRCDIGAIKTDLSEALRNAATQLATLAANTTEIAAVSKRVDAADKQIDLLWARMWAVGIAASGAVVGVTYLALR